MNITEQTVVDVIKTIYRATQWKGIFACKEGCASCCTQNVTITALEGEIILSYCKKNNISIPSPLLDSAVPRPSYTTNQFVRHFIERENLQHAETEQPFGPCFFLQNGLCTIYESRPFMCRSFVSLSDCGQQGYAQVPPAIVTLNTMTQQILEHLSAGRQWGLMGDVLTELNQAQGESSHKTLTCQPIAGFFVNDTEKKMIKKNVGKIYQILTETDKTVHKPIQQLLVHLEKLL